MVPMKLAGCDARAAAPPRRTRLPATRCAASGRTAAHTNSGAVARLQRRASLPGGAGGFAPKLRGQPKNTEAQPVTVGEPPANAEPPSADQLVGGTLVTSDVNAVDNDVSAMGSLSLATPPVLPAAAAEPLMVESQATPKLFDAKAAQARRHGCIGRQRVLACPGATRLSAGC